MRLQFREGNNAAVFANREYAAFNQLMFETALGQEQVTKKEANDKIREVMFEVIGLDKNASRKEIRKACRRNQTAIYEVIEELIPNLLKSGWQSNPFFQQYVEYKNMDDGDTNEFYVEQECILTVSELAGNHHDLIRQRLAEGDTFRVKTSWYGIKCYAEFEKFMNGTSDWAKFAGKVLEAMDLKVNTMLHDAVLAAGNQVKPTSQFYKNIQITAANKDTIITLADDVAMATGEECVIMGTKPALAKLTALTPITWFSDDMKNEYYRTGKLGLWESIRLVEIPQAFAVNDTTKKLEDNSKLLFMPAGDNKFVKMYDEGDVQVKEVTDGNTNMDKTIEYEYQQKMGVATVINKKFGLIDILP